MYLLQSYIRKVDSENVVLSLVQSCCQTMGTKQTHIQAGKMAKALYFTWHSVCVCKDELDSYFKCHNIWHKITFLRLYKNENSQTGESWTWTCLR